MSKIAFILLVTSLLSSARSQTWSGPNQLQPVHGFYVKPSSDGTTGDLYVAATEESGTKAQWLTDQPVNFLPAATSTQATAGQAIPVAYPTYSAPDESSNTQKRAVITSPLAPVQYAYALPFNPTEGAQFPYPYAYPTASSTPETSSATQCEKAAAAATTVPYSPYQFFYPHMMQAYANAKNVLKESGMSDDKASSVIPQASPFWPNSYSYPSYPMYMMVDPSAWAQSQSTQTTSNAANTESSPK